MFCTKCGSSLPDGTKFCTSCGAPTSPEFTAPQTPAAAAPMAAPRRSKKTPVIIAIAAAVIVVFGGAAAFGAKFAPGLFKKIFTPTDEYFRYIVSENVNGGLDEILNLYKNTEDLTHLSRSGSVTLTLDDAGRELLYGMEPMLDEYIGSINSATINCSVNTDDNLLGMKFGLQLSDTDIADAEIVMDSDTEDMYINIPALSDTPFYTSFADADLDEMPDISELLNAYPDAKVLKSLSSRYIDTALDAIPAESIEKTTKTAEVNGIMQDCDYFTVTVTPDVAYNVATAVLTEARGDDELSDMVSDFVSAFEPYYSKADIEEELADGIEEALDELSDLSDYDYSNPVMFGFYVNNLGKIVGMEIIPDNENSFKIMSAQQGSDYNFIISLTNYGKEAFALSGSGNKTGGAFTGDVSFIVEGDEYLDIAVNDFSYENGLMSGSGTINIGADAARIIRSEMDSAIAAFFPIMDFALAFNIENSRDNAFDELSLTQNGEKLATISISAANSSDYVVSLPSGAAHVDDMDDYITPDKLRALVENLRAAGLPSTICDALLYELY